MPGEALLRSLPELTRRSEVRYSGQAHFYGEERFTTGRADGPCSAAYAAEQGARLTYVRSRPPAGR